MRRVLIFLSILALLPAVSWAQFGTAKRIQRMASAPSSCAVGDVYYNTATSKYHSCIAANTWGELLKADENGDVIVAGTLSADALSVSDVPPVLSGAAAPTDGVTACATAGQIYVETTTPQLYWCTDAAADTWGTVVIAGPTLPDAALGGVLGGWNKYTVTFANNAFKTADTAVSIVLGELPANGRIEGLIVDHAAFAGTGITTFTCSLGDGTNHTVYAPALNLLAAAGTSVTHQDGGSFSALKAAHNLTLRCTANVNVGDGAATVLTAGSLDIWLKVSVLQ